MELLSILIDLVIVILLMATIMTAMRLTKNLSVFNQSKAELGRLIDEVSASITTAHNALAEFKTNANETGADLQKNIKEAKLLSDELEMIYQASNRIANRLEKLTDISSVKGKTTQIGDEKTARVKKGKAATEALLKGKKDSFSIKDPDLAKGVKENKDDLSDAAWDGPESIETEAERALFKAINKG